MNEDEQIWYELGIIIGKKEYKDKIKAKIEELKSQIDEHVYYDLGGRSCGKTELLRHYRIKDLKNIEIAVLQSLLEKE